MSVDAIGGILGNQDTSVGKNSNINEQDFIKLFVNQLQYQDPMQPMDNSQFLTQLAQFVGIQQQQETVQGLNNLLSLSANGQAVGLLNQNVAFTGNSGTSTIGAVSAIQFSSSGVTLSVTTSGGNVVTGVKPSQITQITP
ncbi:hypothetical protein GCM10027285_26880 [Oleiagrimonas citrea]|uniref:Basal-body rod modification protein FlgD n=1 Tax=Oleiagrimonas citrea TaxID=1665687 RepID=A0A846ZN93_9GAMM|nr:flagellar hook capping FlgD N-terminal domain-containing protein [Oleiagrimonas citrea]NKZ39028.1 flagellar hook capping protein [Oleiagrimonas citrea]